jgi:hypothetical protein
MLIIEIALGIILAAIILRSFPHLTSPAYLKESINRFINRLTRYTRSGYRFFFLFLIGLFVASFIMGAIKGLWSIFIPSKSQSRNK